MILATVGLGHPSTRQTDLKSLNVAQLGCCHMPSRKQYSMSFEPRGQIHPPSLPCGMRDNHLCSCCENGVQDRRSNGGNDASCIICSRLTAGRLHRSKAALRSIRAVVAYINISRAGLSMVRPQQDQSVMDTSQVIYLVLGGTSGR